jgi:hypothetical protein
MPLDPKPPALPQHLPFHIPQGLHPYPQNSLVLFCPPLCLCITSHLCIVSHLCAMSHLCTAFHLCIVSQLYTVPCLCIASCVSSSCCISCLVFISHLMSCLCITSHVPPLYHVSCPTLVSCLVSYLCFGPCLCLASCLCTIPLYRTSCHVYVPHLMPHLHIVSHTSSSCRDLSSCYILPLYLYHASSPLWHSTPSGLSPTLALLPLWLTSPTTTLKLPGRDWHMYTVCATNILP